MPSPLSDWKLTPGELESMKIHAHPTAEISRKATFCGNLYKIHIGARTRISDGAIIVSGAGEIIIGEYIHISYGCVVQGPGGFFMDDYSFLSAGVTVITQTDDYSGQHLAGPTIPSEFRNSASSPVRISKYAGVGAGATILPGVSMGEGAILGAASLARGHLEPWKIYGGVPCRYLKARQQDCKRLGEMLYARTHHGP